jgi:ribokinase
VNDAGERTITTFGPRLEPGGADAELPWEELAQMDAVYFTAGDLAALRAARAARVLVASPRARHALGHGIGLDALVSSAGDGTEREQAERTARSGEAELILATDGPRGGSYQRRDGSNGSWAPAPLPGPAEDSYGCGDSFAAGFTYALGASMPLGDALALAARCGAHCLTGRGPYERQLRVGAKDRWRQ